MRVPGRPSADGVYRDIIVRHRTWHIQRYDGRLYYPNRFSQGSARDFVGYANIRTALGGMHSAVKDHLISTLLCDDLS